MNKSTIMKKGKTTSSGRRSSKAIKPAEVPAEGAASLKQLWQLYVARIGAADFSRTLLGPEAVCKICYDEAVTAAKIWDLKRAENHVE